MVLRRMISFFDDVPKCPRVTNWQMYFICFCFYIVLRFSIIDFDSWNLVIKLTFNHELLFELINLLRTNMDYL